MNLNFFEEIGKSIEKTIKIQTQKLEDQEGIENNEIELAQKLGAIEEYTIDRFEENIAVVENRDTGKMKNISKDKLPSECKEGDIVKCINGKYFLDKEQTEKIENEIQEKYKNLWE